MKLNIQLKSLLKQRGTTVTNLAKATRVPTQTLHNWLAGAKPRDLDQVKTVAEFFAVSLDYLVYGVEQKKEISPLDELKDEINAGTFEVILRKVKK